jgi:medium-chain acyl-[acyl-carrier-protein] hydrolase
MKKDKIFKRYNVNAKNRMRLFIFPYAGCRASMFKEFENSLSPYIEICAMQLPGREERFLEKPFDNIDALLEEWKEHHHSYMDMPFAFYGHSMGALLCYEVAYYMEIRKKALPLHVFISGSYPPHHLKYPEDINKLPDDALIEELKKINGIPLDLLDNIDLVKLFLPIIRADLSIAISYTYKRNYIFSFPLTVFCGESDPIVNHLELQKWKPYTNKECKIFTYPGDHFFIFSPDKAFLKVINDQLLQYLPN